MNRAKRRIILALALFVWLPRAHARDYARLVVFSDLHLPGRLLDLKEQAIQTVNGWKDVDAVVAPGDIVEETGTDEEYAFAKDFLSKLRKPLYPLAGNHEYMYVATENGGKKRGTPADRASHLELFQKAFSLPSPCYEKKIGGYQCFFISTDDLYSPYLTAMSTRTLSWLKQRLKEHRDTPSIVFFHSPLKGTYLTRPQDVEDPNFIAQPHERLRELIRQNPQLFLWVSGHVHIAPSNARFDHPANLYAGRVIDIHNCDMDGRSALTEADTSVVLHDNIWTNSLFLYPDKVVVKTYDHNKQAWLEKLTREIRPRHPKP